jgi:hypothetical protein
VAHVDHCSDTSVTFSLEGHKTTYSIGSFFQGQSALNKVEEAVQSPSRKGDTAVTFVVNISSFG